MTGQSIITWAIIAAASLYLLQRLARFCLGRKGGCAQGCGCASKEAGVRSGLITADEIVGRLRRDPPSR